MTGPKKDSQKKEAAGATTAPAPRPPAARVTADELVAGKLVPEALRSELEDYLRARQAFDDFFGSGGRPEISGLHPLLDRIA